MALWKMPEKEQDRKFNNSLIDSQADERARGLLKVLLDEGADPQLHARVREWLLNRTDDQADERAFAGMLEEFMRRNDYPDAVDQEQLRIVLRRIGEIPAAAKPAPLRRRSFLHVAVRVAAVVIPFAAVMGVAYFSGWPGGETPGAAVDVIAESRVTVKAVEGVQKNVTLADSSAVWINAGSEITYPENFEDTERHVQLKGEAYFAVARNEVKPFFVHTDKLHVRVLGTEFNVTENTAEGTTRVTLHKGLVEVTIGLRNERLDPGQTLTYYHASDEMTVVNSAQSDWRAEAIYTGTHSLGMLFNMIANYYDVNIEFDESDFTDTELFSFALKKDVPAEKVIASLSELSQYFDYESREGNITIAKRQ